MNRMYYLFSESKKLEAIYVCENDRGIDQPSIKTNVYRMGTLLSCTVKFLTTFIDIKPKTNSKSQDGSKSKSGNYDGPIMLLKFYDSLNKSEAFINQYKYESSFSSVTENDVNIRTVFKILSTGYEYFSSDKLPDKSSDESPDKSPDNYHDRSLYKFKELLEVLEHFMDLCYEDTKNCNNDSLGIITEYYGYNPPRRSRYISTNDNLSSLSSNEEKIQALLKTVQKKDEFDPPIFRRKRELFNLNEDSSYSNAFGTLELPIYTYEIRDFVDLIAVSLECIFERKYVIRKCKNCGEFFVAYFGQQRFCSSKVDVEKNCREQYYLKQQLINEKTIASRRVHKNISEMLAHKLGIDHKRYKYFLEQSKYHRHKMKSGNETEDEYITWMNNYWAKVKLFYKFKKKKRRKIMRRYVNSKVRCITR